MYSIDSIYLMLNAMYVAISDAYPHCYFFSCCGSLNRNSIFISNFVFVYSSKMIDKFRVFPSGTWVRSCGWIFSTIDEWYRLTSKF